MGVTIATHNGSAYRREHNVRNEKVVSKEAHIQKDGVFEIWHDEKPREAYGRIFGEAQRAYNEKQARADRKIDSYYNEVSKDAKKHAVYEMIIGVYGYEDGVQLCSEEEGKAIMREFVDGWQERNPNLEIIGAYYHADEEGEPHVHIDYVPVAHGYKNGMETQNGLVKAFGEMGFEKQGRATAQIQWEARENATLDSICRKHGLEVDHPKDENRQHVHTETYKAQQALESTIEHTKGLLDAQDVLRAETGDLERQRDKANKQTARALERASKSVKLHRDKQRQGYTYDKSLVDDIKRVAKEVKQDAKAIEHTDLDVATRYDQAEALKRQQEHELERTKEYCREERERADREAKRIIAKAEEYKDKQESYILGTSEKIADRKVKELLQETDDRYTKRLEKFVAEYSVNGQSLLDKFKEQEQELARKLHRGLSR